MSKYTALGRYLHETGRDTVTISFAEIERILGTALPASARTHRAWWSNNAENNVATREWLGAGYQTQQVDIKRGRLVFRKRGAPVRVAEPLAPVWPGSRETMEQVEEVHISDPLFGALKGTVHIPPGVDLTEPVMDPEEWEKIWNEKWDQLLGESE